jgi:hypothetical protein
MGTALCVFLMFDSLDLAQSSTDLVLEMHSCLMTDA